MNTYATRKSQVSQAFAPKSHYEDDYTPKSTGCGYVILVALIAAAVFVFAVVLPAVM